MTDFSHLHALEERAVNIHRSMMAAKKDVQWRSLAVQLFQTEQEIADERTFLELEDMSTDDLYAALFEEAESEVVREITKELNAAEQAANIRTAAEALVAALTKEPDDYDGLVYYEYSKELAGLQAALSRGWLARKEPNSMCECGVPLSPEASFLNQCGEPICKCGHPKASHNSLNTQPGYSNWQCTNCVCREFQEGE